MGVARTDGTYSLYTHHPILYTGCKLGSSVHLRTLNNPQRFAMLLPKTSGASALRSEARACKSRPGTGPCSNRRRLHRPPRHALVARIPVQVAGVGVHVEVVELRIPRDPM